MGEGVCGMKGDSQLLSWPFKRYQGIRLGAINPTVFTPLPTLTAYITKPSSRLKTGFHEGFCCPGALLSTPVPPASPHSSTVESTRKILKSNEVWRICRDGWRAGSYLGFSTIFLLQSLLNYTERKNKGQIAELPSEFTALKRRLHFDRFLARGRRMNPVHSFFPPRVPGH